VARFVVALIGITHFVAGPFWSGPFWREFHENNSFLFAFSNFLIFLSLFSFFFLFKNSRRLFVHFKKISFHSTVHKKIQVQKHRYCFFIRLFQ